MTAAPRAPSSLSETVHPPTPPSSWNISHPAPAAGIAARAKRARASIHDPMLRPPSLRCSSHVATTTCTMLAID